MKNEGRYLTLFVFAILLIFLVYAAPSFTIFSPQSELQTTNTSIEINASIYEDLQNFIFNWNGTNYSMYDPTLILMWNFENVSSLGENESLIKDVGTVKNNGTIELNNSISRIALISSFNLSSIYVQGIAYDGEYLYITYAGGTSYNNTIEKRYLNGTIITKKYPLNNTDYETAGITYMEGNLYVAINGYTGALSGATYNKVMVFDTNLTWLQNITGFTGDYLEGVNKYDGSYWAIYDDKVPANASISQHDLSWVYITNYTLRTDLGTNNHKYQGISFYNDSLGNSYLFTNVHDDTFPETLDKYLWDGTSFTLVKKMEEATEFGHQDIEIYNDTFFWVSRQQNKTFITNHTYSNYFDGKFGKGLLLGYNNSISSTLVGLNKSAGTISLWVKLYGHKNTQWIFTEQATANNNNEIEIYASSSGNITNVVWGGTTPNVPTQIPISLGEWTHITLTWNSTHVCNYKDGILYGDCDTSVTLPTAVASSALYGKALNSAGSSTAGTIDEVRIWSRSLSSSEIYEAYISNLKKINSTYYAFYINQSKNATNGLNYGNYTYQLFATNTSGSLSQTDTINISVMEDLSYPIFVNYQDNNATLTNSGTAWFNVTVTNTNGTVILDINNTNVTATNLTTDVYNASITLTDGTYSYRWFSNGNGVNNLVNSSPERIYTILLEEESTEETGNTGGGGSILGYCKRNSNCKKGYTCYNHNCTLELFKIKLSDVKGGNNSVVFKLKTEPNNRFIENTTISYLIQQGNQTILNGSQPFYINGSSEKTFQIPVNLTKGDYTLYINVSYGNFTVQEMKSFKYDPKKEVTKIKKASQIIFLLAAVGLFIFFYLILKFSKQSKFNRHKYTYI